MTRKFIGIDIDGGQVRVAIAAADKGGAKIVSTASAPCPDREETAATVRGLLGSEPGFGDRLAAALPATAGFVRRLAFPFAESRKIEAAAPLELSARLPVPTGECVVSLQKPVPDDQGGCTVVAAAVRQRTVGEFLAPFDSGGLPLHVLDLAPYAYAAGLRQHLADGLLACIGEREITLCRIAGGRVSDYRLLPLSGDLPAAELAELLRRESPPLLRGESTEERSLLLIGSRADERLLEELRRQGTAAAFPLLAGPHGPLSADFIPSAALALRAALVKDGELNLRLGPFALKSEWASLKRRLTAIAALLALSLLSVVGAASLNYLQLAGRAEGLQEEMVRVFRETFPGTKAVVDVPLQMTARLNELKKKGRMIGAVTPGSPLAVLKEISRLTPEELTVDVHDFSYTPEGARIEGETSSFDAVNRLSRTLEQSPLFAEVQIGDAKMGMDGSRVSFRLNIVFGGERKER